MNTRRNAFSLIELIVVIGILVLLAALLLPALERGREQAMQVKCANNLQQIGAAIAIYTNATNGAYPRTTYVADAPIVAGTNPDAIDPFIQGPQPNDITSAVFLLIRTQQMPPVIFTCPYTDVKTYVPEPAKNLSARSNFTNYRDNLGYSFANPYPSAALAHAGYQLTSHLSGSFAIAADLNSGEGGKKNSDNHEDRGQNVLFADGHVEWASSPLVGIKEDNIYTNRAGIPGGMPSDATDSVLIPTKP